MKKVRIRNREYTTKMSGAIAISQGKALAELAYKEEKGNLDVSEMMEKYYELLHLQLKSYRLGLPLIQRCWLAFYKPIPNLERLKHLLEFSEVQLVIQGDTTIGGDQEEEEKSPK